MVYCDKMDTEQPEEYISLRGQNFAEIYHKRLRNTNSCPYQGRRNDSCDCSSIDSENSGRTVFWKVRLNVTSLKISGV